jgi:hypothetical protein
MFIHLLLSVFPMVKDVIQGETNEGHLESLICHQPVICKELDIVLRKEHSPSRTHELAMRCLHSDGEDHVR